jgi:chromosome segregation protein
LFKLKKVEILGFKSFADRTRLEFADGIVAVVGPNGCGKSNLSDAISWVLGEQSARSLRGERMADVIFNGTSARLATGMAEVSLTLVDPESIDVDGGGTEESPEANIIDAAPAEGAAESGGSNGNGAADAENRPHLQHRAGEITVTRRLFRSGESEYLINDEICRLRDIQDLFMGTGLGPESYAIIEQGRIGQILSSKPSDRRLIIEEAAGVSKFKTRKRLAEAKLESSRQNLSRITDILEEVTKQVGSLKRQASKARRYRELHDELRGRLKTVLTSRLRILDSECQRLRNELASAQTVVAEAAQKLEEQEREQKAAIGRHEETEARLTELREGMAQRDLERERLLSRIEQMRQQAATLETRTAEAAAESDQITGQLASLELETAEAARQRDQLGEQLAAAQATLRKTSAQQEELGAELSEAEKAIEAGRQELLAAVSQAAELRNQLVQAEETGLALERQASRLGAERTGVEQEHARLTAELETFGSEQTRDQSVLAELTGSFSEKTTALDTARFEEVTRRSEVEDLRQELSRVGARRQALEESLARHAYSTETVRHLLSSDIPVNGHRFRPLGLLADFVEVTPGYEEVVEEFLKGELDCVVVEQHEEARSGISLLRSEGTGRSTFFVTHARANGHSNGHADSEIRRAPGVLAAVQDLVRFEERLGLNGDVALPALANAYVVDNASTAERMVATYPEGHFLTATGEHYYHRLVSGGKGESAGPLALRRDFRDLEKRTGDLENTLRSAEAALAEMVGRVARLEEELRGLAGAKLEAEKKAVLANEKLRQTRDGCERAAERLRILREESSALESERAGVLSRQATLRAQLEAVAAERAQREAELVAMTQKARDWRVSLDQLGQELVEARAQSSTLEERNHSIEAECARLAARREELGARLLRLEEQRGAWVEEQQQLALQGEASRTHLGELEVEQQTARQEFVGLEEEARTVRARRDELSQLIDAARLELDALREKRSEAEVSLARLESDYAHHVNQCREDLSAEPDALLAELDPERALEGELLVTAEEQIREMKKRIENLGPVNMMALEELQEAEERFTFLETQRQDLLASIQDTAQAIREIDEVSRRQFLEAFKTINANFAESFRTLFGGGAGEMRLNDPADPDSGIDIAAQPPGKRLQNVLLLSGGEKALAALALLIALFRYTPSPFCILDEVDAPLDESNIDRFTRMIQHMSRHTQFILITHNKRTMEIAQVLYGVTMQEPGVSKLVSVRFDDDVAEPVAEPVPA